jgi:hypothetical protein
MTRQSGLRKFLLLAAAVAGAVVLVWVRQEASAQQPSNGPGAGPPPRIYVPSGPPIVGGYSLRLSDVWGPAKMPPAPKDFGPHFDFPPAPLNSVPLPDPYPH